MSARKRKKRGVEKAGGRGDEPRGSYNWIFAIKSRFLVKLVNDLGFWRLGANNYMVRASVVFRLQCETYFNERVAMESVWNEARGVGPRSCLGIEVAMFAVEPSTPGYEGRTRRSLKWKCHWRKVKVINGICPSYRVNSMSDAIVAARYTYTTGMVHDRRRGARGLFLKEAETRMAVGGKPERVRKTDQWKLYVQMKTKYKENGGKKLREKSNGDVRTIRRAIKCNEFESEIVLL